MLTALCKMWIGNKSIDVEALYYLCPVKYSTENLRYKCCFYKRVLGISAEFLCSVKVNGRSLASGLETLNELRR